MRDVRGRLMTLGALVTLGVACGSGSNSQGNPDGSPGGSGGATGSGGGASSGGATGSGGASGSVGSGGAIGSGGVPVGGGGSNGSGGCPARASFTQADHIIMNVTWPSGLATMGGNAQVHIWTKVVFTANGSALTGIAQACGTVLPPTGLTAIAGGGMILIEFPDAAWDAPSMPKFDLQVTQSGWDVGSTLTYGGNAMVGFTMDPGATWPSAYTGVTGIVDADGDGAAGLTAVPRAGGGYVAPPTSILQTARADKVQIVTRNTQSAMLTRTSCDRASGPVTFMHFDNHVVACHVSGGQDCSAGEVSFVDQNRTVYQVTSATQESKVVPDNATCAAVRSALPM